MRTILPILVLVAALAGYSLAVEPPPGPGSRAVQDPPVTESVKDLLAGRFRWTARGPLVSPASRPDSPCVSVKDPSIVRYKDRWHMFCSIRGTKRSHAIEYLAFADFKDADKAQRVVLPAYDGFWCAPQVFYFSPHKKWYLVCQASSDAWERKYQCAFSTSDNIQDPKSWAAPKPMGLPPADGNKAGLDFWVICDADHAHLFFTTLDGRMWRSQTKLGDFPAGWSKPVLAIQGDIFEAGHTYRLKGLDKFLTIVEAQGGHGWRYYKAYLADRLDGPWKELAASRDQAFASMRNVAQPGGRWTDCISHVELLRAGFDEKLEVDLADLRLIFQGVSDKARAGLGYGQIPWRLGILEPAR